MEVGESICAACVTPAGSGGIAVIQVIGSPVAEVIEPHLQADKPIDLASLVPDQLRLCRVVEGNKVIDDAVIAASRDDMGRLVVEINLHGGPRVVQRVLLLLKRAGVEILDGRGLLQVRCAGRPCFEREAAEAMLSAKTRPVAAWLARTIEQLPKDIDAMLAELAAGRPAQVHDHLASRCAEGEWTRYLLNGVRVVLVGRPNTGKSTLANRLAGRELAVVSNQPGTTRDWTEHHGAIEGIPFTFVDTAGIRLANDPIEQEAIQHTHAQIAPADLVVRILDASLPPYEDDRQAIEKAGAPGNPLTIFAWNKTDLGIHAEQARLIESARGRAVTVSGLTGEGLDALRSRMISALELENWQISAGAPFTSRQLAAYRATLAALSADPPNPKEAAARLKSVTSFQAEQEDP